MSGRIGQEAEDTASCPKVCRDPAPISGTPTHRFLLRHPRPSSFSGVERPFWLCSLCLPISSAETGFRNPPGASERGAVRNSTDSGYDPFSAAISVFSNCRRGRDFNSPACFSQVGRSTCGAEHVFRSRAASHHPTPPRRRDAGIKPASPAE